MDDPNHHHISIYVIPADVTQPFYTADSWNGDNKVILISRWVGGSGTRCADIGINPTKEIGFN